MDKPDRDGLPSRIEEILLLVVWELGDEAYGIPIGERAGELLRRRLSVGAVYVPLERMVAKGWLVPEDGAPSPVRGGRRRRYYRLTPAGAQALRAARNLSHRIWAGKPARLPTRQERAKAET